MARFPPKGLLKIELFHFWLALGGLGLGKDKLMEHDANDPTSSTNVDLKFSKLQAAFRGSVSRKLHAKRVKDPTKMVCPFYASNDTVVSSIIQIGKIASDDIVYDLGCGNGNVLIKMATSIKCQCIGFEIDILLCQTARRLAKQSNVDHLVDIVVEDICNVRLNFASVICLFLVPSCLAILSPKLLVECQPQTRIVCYKFPLPVSDGWTPISISETDDVVNTKNPLSKSQVFLYEI